MQTKKVKDEWAGYKPTGRGIDWANRSEEDLARDAAFAASIVKACRDARAAAELRRREAG